MIKHHIFYSITNPVLIAGVPFNYAIFLFSVAALLQLYIGAFIGIGATGMILISCLVMYLAGIVLTTRDKSWFEVLLNVFKFSPANFFVKKIKYVA